MTGIQNGRRWAKWILLVLFAWAAISSAVVLPYAHIHWQDEVQIVEIARGGIVDKPECWSMLASGNPKVDAQAWAIYYVGGWMLEQAYQLAGHLGPRCLTMTAFALLALVFGFYLYKKTGDGALSAMLALLLLSFPPLQSCARGGEGGYSCSSVCIAVPADLADTRPIEWREMRRLRTRGRSLRAVSFHLDFSGTSCSGGVVGDV